MGSPRDSPPTSSNMCGPAIEGPRIKLRDGRHLAYKDHGVPKETAKYKLILVNGFVCSRHDAFLAKSQLVEKLRIHFVAFDRPGYGESDPDPKRTIKSTALDIQELGDQLELGPKFYVIGISMGGQAVWGCLKYISHRLAGAALIVPVVNYWWPGFPSSLAREAYHQQLPRDQWALRVAHHAPWLVYWWNTQRWFPYSSAITGSPHGAKLFNGAYATQQGVYESFHRELMIGFGKWDFCPMSLDDPFPNNGEGSVHLRCGAEDASVAVDLVRYIAKKLPWIKYHELSDAGHMFVYDDSSAQDAILTSLLIGG